MKKYKLSSKLYKAHEKLRKRFLKEAKKNPGIFSGHKFCPQAKKYILQEFPLEHYGQQIDGIVFEAWGLRSLLESAFNAGFKMAKDPQEWQRAQKEIKKLGKMLESFRVKLSGRTFHPPLVIPLKVEGDVMFFQAASGMRSKDFKEYQCSLKEYLAEKKRIEKLAKKVFDLEK